MIRKLQHKIATYPEQVTVYVNQDIKYFRLIPFTILSLLRAIEFCNCKTVWNFLAWFPIVRNSLWEERRATVRHSALWEVLELLASVPTLLQVKSLGFFCEIIWHFTRRKHDYIFTIIPICNKKKLSNSTWWARSFSIVIQPRISFCHQLEPPSSKEERWGKKTKKHYQEKNLGIKKFLKVRKDDR